MKLALHKSDVVGVLASALCLLHCLATPFIFIAQACSVSCCDSAPAWWKWLDYFFLVISFFAVYRSTQTTSSNLMKPVLWISWGALFVMIINENLKLLPLPKSVTYIVAIALAVLHLYNLNYCQCKTDKCCTNHA